MLFYQWIIFIYLLDYLILLLTVASSLLARNYEILFKYLSLIKPYKQKYIFMNTKKKHTNDMHKNEMHLTVKVKYFYMHSFKSCLILLRYFQYNRIITVRFLHLPLIK